MVMDRRPDRGYGLDRSREFPVLIGLGPVRSRSFSSLETGPSNTIYQYPQEIITYLCGINCGFIQYLAGISIGIITYLCDINGGFI